jgi:hypothetical protein
MSGTIKVDTVQANGAASVTVNDALVVNETLAVTGASTLTGAVTANTFASSGATITGGSVTGITDLAVADGGTGASTAAGARTNLDVPSNSEAILDTLIAAKGDLIVGTANDTPAILTAGANGKTLVTASGETSGLIWTDYTREPININPNWLIDQINEGAAYGFATTVNGIAMDGWSVGNQTDGTITANKQADPDNVALKCALLSCTVADAAIGAAQYAIFYTAIEGYDAAYLCWGTASAQSITIQFKAKFNVTGTYGISIANSAQNRCYLATFTVPDTNENSYSVTIPGDTSGTWLYTNGVGMYIVIGLAVGSDKQGTAGAWGATVIYGTAANANFMSANTNTAYIKRFHVIPGGVALAYANHNIQRELAKVQRYYEKSYLQGVAVGAVSDLNRVGGYAQVASATVTQGMPVKFKVEKRANPTIALYNPATGGTGTFRNDSAGTNIGNTVDLQGTSGFTADSAAGGLSANDVYTFHYIANARLS